MDQHQNMWRDIMTDPVCLLAIGVIWMALALGLGIVIGKAIQLGDLPPEQDVWADAQTDARQRFLAAMQGRDQ